MDGLISPEALAALPPHEAETIRMFGPAIDELGLDSGPPARRQPKARRNLFAHFLGEVLGWADPEIAELLGLGDRQSARLARLRGSRLTPGGRLDPLGSMGSRRRG